MTISGLIAGGNAITDGTNWLVVGGTAQYLFLKDHYISQYIPAGSIEDDDTGLVPQGWLPTPNVDPLTLNAVQAFYAMGPALAGPIKQKPVTYWFETSPNIWALTGLGADQNLYPLVQAYLGRVE